MQRKNDFMNVFEKVEACGFSSSYLCSSVLSDAGERIMTDIQSGAYCIYENMDFGNGPGATGFEAMVKTDSNACWIEIRIDDINSKIISVCQVAKRDMGSNWCLVKSGMYNITGIHTVYLTFKGSESDRMDIRWFRFTLDLFPGGKFFENTLLPAQVPYLGPMEDNFFGSGIAGAGGDVQGVWNYLIGPSYTCDNMIEKEELRILINGNEVNITPEMHRARGTGMFYGIQQYEELTIFLFDFTNFNVPWVTRMVLVENNGLFKTYSMEFRAYISPSIEQALPFRGHKAAKFSLLNDTAVLIEQDGNNYSTVTFIDVATTVTRVGDNYILKTGNKSISPGENSTVGMYHYMHNDKDNSSSKIHTIRSRDVKADAQECIQQWALWLAKGKSFDKIPDLKVRDILEANIVNIKMQQGMDGGIMATPRTYDLSYVRDNYSGLRGLAAAGHFEEAKKFIKKMDNVYYKLRREERFGIPTATVIGTDSAFIGEFFGIAYDYVFMGVFDTKENWIAETPALYILVVANYYKNTGDLQTLKDLDESLRYAINEQLEFAEANDWKLYFNGDETESSGSGIPVNEKPGKFEWSMTSLAFCAASLEFFITYLEVVGNKSEIPDYQKKLENIKNSLDSNFWREDLGIHDWYRGVHGEWPSIRLPNYNLMLMYYKIPLNNPERAVSNVLAMKQYVNAKGFLPLQSDRENEDFCGHNLGYLLYDLVEINDPMKDQIYDTLINSGITGCWGTWSEAYHGDGLSYSETWDNRIHNLRPFESGINIDAILKYWGLA